VSRAGVMPLSWSNDHVGPMARTVRDAARLLHVIAGRDPRDGTSSHRAVPDYTARIDDHAIFQTSNLYLAVSSRTPAEIVLTRFPSLIKIGSVVKMREIVNNALQAGIRIAPTPSPPPQLRVMPGFVYFELDRSSPDWRDLDQAPALGLHVAGDWPELRMELWWVKRGR